MTPVPTPYDIIPPPYFPYVPGQLVWILFLVCTVLTGSILWHLQGRKKSLTSRVLLLDQATLELCKIRPPSTQEFLFKTDLVRCSLLVRRLLSSIMNISADALSNVELQQLAKTTNNSRLRKILHLLSKVDDYRFEPESNPTTPKSWLEDLITELENLKSDIQTGHSI